MKHRILVIVAFLLLTGAALCILLLVNARDEEEEEHYRNGETELVVSNVASAGVVLFSGGKGLSDAAPLSGVIGDRIWLKSGNYFLKAGESLPVLFVPVPLTGYRCGPDADGSFRVTIRPMHTDRPPRLFSTQVDYVYIPSGSFLLGDRQNPRERHYVWLTGYYMAPFEVSNREFRAFISDPAGYRNHRNWNDEGARWMASSRSQTTALLLPQEEQYTRFGQPDQPVTSVTWFEAHAYCKWLTGKIGEGKWLYSLPTDAEWEKAARGPDNFDYGLSMSVSDNEVALYNWKKNPNAIMTVVGTESTPGLYLANRYGLYHMTGNVAEWSQSVVSPYNRENPWRDDQRNLDETPGLRTVRGGSWYSASIAYLYIPYRDSFQPEHCTQDIGFRVVARRLP